ncbi:HAMP domain-containing sensor histidine kinase [Cognatishimia sp. SS12]|uniref:sensor histidine kinase n=1 Tax=Cognatishimia sp. SS12 TaxID=2979465 RepID=UPI00232E51B8|nr:HAMP domain-containing sensor histidine kinase [Cognatishimia sp. SS12]MDC0739404.1 HAMP domain-containing sensor histidine kinase [Cognatishimia sp. SS12]
MKHRLRSLQVLGPSLMIAALLIGAAAAWLWMQSTANWRDFRNQAYASGITLYHALQDGTAVPAGTNVLPLPAEDQILAKTGAFARLSIAPMAARDTIVPISVDAENIGRHRPLTLVILSPDLTYPLARLSLRDNHTAAEITGAVFRLIASYCSAPVVLARVGGAPWVELRGDEIWSCAAAPRDLRLPAALLLVLAAGVLVTLTLNTTAHFSQFAEELRRRRRVGGPESYAAAGPQELQEIIAAVNSYLETERAQLESRAAILSGVSHDLGTPATRLRLRSALIADAELREKLEADIDRMTEMIESVLTYTRAEMSVEAPRKLSLTALVDSIVADYQDTGRAVELMPVEDVVVQGARSVFMSRQGQGVLSKDQDVIVIARPVSLQRALSNLIDNALKYGRRAHVSLTSDATTATVIVEDEGRENTAQDIEKLMLPFRRGDNTQAIDGFGLGLTIVATIAGLHGGALSFEDGRRGLRACLTIQRQ